MYPAYVREKARRLRTERHLSIDEIAERLALPKTTIYYWVRDLPLGRPRRNSPLRGIAAMQRKYGARRTEAYLEGRASFEHHCTDSTFRDFVCMYIGEGSKRNRNRVAICNSDPAVLQLAATWLHRLSAKQRHYCIQYHADQNLDELRAFWGTELRIDPGEIRLQRKSNSGRLSGRSWRSAHGVLTVTVNDTLLRARLQAWMDCVQEQWLHSPINGA
jgi:AcrR family transcriptional regulator